jgi:hypothetical protein
MTTKRAKLAVSKWPSQAMTKKAIAIAMIVPARGCSFWPHRKVHLRRNSNGPKNTLDPNFGATIKCHDKRGFGGIKELTDDGRASIGLVVPMSLQGYVVSFVGSRESIHAHQIRICRIQISS